jgi:tetratricopeptide (TPR) repeat protein
MMKDPVLNRALRLAKRKKYGDAISLLEGEILRYRESFRFYYILSLCCLYTGDYGRAYTYFKSANDIKPKDSGVVLGIAALNLRRGESGRALDLYLKVLEIEPRSRIAKKALSVLRRYAGSDEFADWIESGRIKRLFPPLPKAKMTGAAVLGRVLVALALILGVVFCAAVKKGLVNIDAMRKEQREGFATSALESGDRKNIVALGGSYQSILTERQVLASYEKARGLFNEYDDNPARIEINRLLLSNAADGIKNKARVLLRYLDETPLGFDTLKTNLSYAQVQKEPLLCDGCYVVWRGMATNILVENESSSFDFLVGYENRTNLAGIVRVVCPFAAFVSSEQPLEVLARIRPQSDVGAASFSLTGAALHQLSPR